MVPARIWLSFKNNLSDVQTDGLVFVNDLVHAAKKDFSRSLRAYDTSDITLHTAEHAEPLTSHSRLAEHAEQLSACGLPETPLIVKVKSNVEEDIVRFWKALPEATLVVDGEMEYLELKDSTYVLGRQNLGHRLLVRPVYKELCEHFEQKSSCNKWVVAGTPGIGKTIFSAYCMWIAACKKKTVVWEPFRFPENNPLKSYLMTSGGVELVDNKTSDLANALNNPETVYIIDGKALPMCGAWTLHLTPPHLHRPLRQLGFTILYMGPWDWEEMEHCKAILYPNEEILPTKLMDRLFDWYGGVPRYVLELASARLKALDGNEEAVLQEMVAKVKLALDQSSPFEFFQALQAASISGDHPHLVIHIQRHPSGNLDQFHLRWASHQTRTVMEKVMAQEIRSGSSCGKMLMRVMAGES
ncbi:hypothetical protein PGT21_004232 [Puccinia graminis f. sp. tritici]|uniref:Uncharacterized protein n=1 Tax=Puccinia graminis f. sp. tritici TaxID=56615 RepID=A0A5B0NMN6_PUCGR|nr:hypothetical protein PGTUg99_032170 [Puccinia graminis f. sp. tritici]KAA1090527.1 hypothetical protein PGT21_004232 [Puccinia graminis f. sp. tritici]